MRTAAIVLLVLVLAVGGALGWELFHTNLQVTGKALETLPAAERVPQYDALRTAVSRQSLLGTVLKKTEMGPAENYSYYIYTLRLKNNGLVPAEMVEMQVAPIENDVLFYGDTQETVIPPGGEKDVWCVLLTEGTPHSVRDLYVTYYLWGHPQEVKFTYDEAR